MAAWDLPYRLNVGGVDYEIREDFRAVLDILTAFSDDELNEKEKTQAMIEILYYPVLPPPEALEEAAEAAAEPAILLPDNYIEDAQAGVTVVEEIPSDADTAAADAATDAADNDKPTA